MADIVPATVIECRAAQAALARCTVPTGMVWIALRPDRALGVVLREPGRDSAQWVQRLQDVNPGLLAVDVSPGWVALALTGDQARRLPALIADDIDGRTHAGEVAGVPAVVVPVDGGTTILVGASYARHLTGQLGPGVQDAPGASMEPDSAGART